MAANGKEGGSRGRGANSKLLAHYRSLNHQERAAYAKAWDAERSTPSALRRTEKRRAMEQAVQDAVYGSVKDDSLRTTIQLADLGLPFETARRLGSLTVHPVEGTKWKDRLETWAAHQGEGKK